MQQQQRDTRQHWAEWRQEPEENDEPGESAGGADDCQLLLGGQLVRPDPDWHYEAQLGAGSTFQVYSLFQKLNVGPTEGPASHSFLVGLHVKSAVVLSHTQMTRLELCGGSEGAVGGAASWHSHLGHHVLPELPSVRLVEPESPAVVGGRRGVPLMPLAMAGEAMRALKAFVYDPRVPHGSTLGLCFYSRERTCPHRVPGWNTGVAFKRRADNPGDYYRPGTGVRDC